MPTDCPWTLEQFADNATLAVESMCELLVGKPFFNYTSNLLTTLVPCMGMTSAPSVCSVTGGAAHGEIRAKQKKVTHTNRVAHGPPPAALQIARRVCTAVNELFDNDERGEVSLQAVRVITQHVRQRGYRLPAAVLDTFLHLRLLDELDPSAAGASGGADGTSQRQRKGTKAHQSKRQRKVRVDARAHAAMGRWEASVPCAHVDQMLAACVPWPRPHRSSLTPLPCR